MNEEPVRCAECGKPWKKATSRHLPPSAPPHYKPRGGSSRLIRIAPANHSFGGGRASQEASRMPPTQDFVPRACLVDDT
jgi:hypothetical protein